MTKISKLLIVLYILRDQLDTFIIHVRRVDDFITCLDIGSFVLKMVQTETHLAFPLVYHLIELALLLLVATTSVERAFSAMNIIKNDLQNRMLDDWLKDLCHGFDASPYLCFIAGSATDSKHYCCFDGRTWVTPVWLLGAKSILNGLFRASWIPSSVEERGR
jgi:hypothetical protein